MSGADVVIATLDRNGNDKLVVSLRQFEGHHYVDLRVHFVNEHGELRATTKGFTIKMRELHAVHDALGKACELAKGIRK